MVRMLLLLTVAAQVPAQSGLAGTSWQLVKFEGGDGSVVTPDNRAKYTIAFDTNDGVNVRIDCNRGRGTWKSEGTQLQFGPLAVTRAMCPPGSLFDRVARDWQSIRSYTMKDGHVYLALMADGGIYEFQPTVAMGHSQPLENTNWKLTQLGGMPVKSAVPQREPYLVFSPQRRVSGSGGCNRISGSYELNGDRLSLSQLIGTMMACPEGMETEKAFLSAMGRVNKWTIADQHLELFDAGGNLLAVFEARVVK